MEAWLAPFVEAGVDVMDCSQRRFWEPEFDGSSLNLAGWAKKLTGLPVITAGSVGLSTDVMSFFHGETAKRTSLNELLRRFDAGEFDVATIFYNRFQSVISQIPTAQQIIPAVFEDAAEDVGAETPYDYEPSEEAILSDLLPIGVTTQIFTALLENGASEQGARMSAMDNATRNAGDMIDKLTIEFNRSRQAVITNELIEIISGAEAL